MRVNKLKALFVLTTILFPDAKVSSTEQTLEFDLSQASDPRPCDDMDAWTVKPLAPICEHTNTCSELKEASAIKNHDNLFHDCFYEKSRCTADFADQDTFVLNYVPPLPTVYGDSVHDLLLNISFQTYSNSSDSGKLFAFFPATAVIGNGVQGYSIPDTLEIDKNEIYRKFEVGIHSKPTTGIAWCRVRKIGAGYAMPDHCIITEMYKEGTKFILGRYRDIRKYIPDTGCFAAWSGVLGPGFDLDNQSDIRNFSTIMVGEIESPPLKMSSALTETSFSSSGAVATIETSSGIRLSPIDDTKREQLDITLKVVPKLDIPPDQQLYGIAMKLAAWVNPQNTERPEDWRMPNTSYYESIRDKLFTIAKESYLELCKTRNKAVIDHFPNGQSGFTCK